MSDFRPRSSSEILDASFEIYRRNFAVFIAISVFTAIPSAIATYFSQAAMVLQRPDGIFTSALISLLGLLIAPFTYGSVACAASDAYLGKPVGVEHSVRAAFRRPGMLFGAMVRKWVLVSFGLALFLVPGLIVYKRYFALPMTILFEDNTIGSAVARSRELSNGSGTRIFSLNGGVLVFTTVVAFNLGLTITSFSHGAIAAVGHLIVIMVLSPFSTIVATLLYYDIRIRREGYDIELMTQALDVTSPMLN